jgi:hypothetical protein
LVDLFAGSWEYDTKCPFSGCNSFKIRHGWLFGKPMQEASIIFCVVNGSVQVTYGLQTGGEELAL